MRTAQVKGENKISDEIFIEVYNHETLCIHLQTEYGVCSWLDINCGFGSQIVQARALAIRPYFFGDI